MNLSQKKMLVFLVHNIILTLEYKEKTLTLNGSFKQVIKNFLLQLKSYQFHILTDRDVEQQNDSIL